MCEYSGVTDWEPLRKAYKQEEEFDVTKKEWLEQKIMVDEWGRPPSLADVPLTIMTRKQALIKQGGDDKSINKLYKESDNG